MPSNYISLMNPPDKLVEAYDKKAAAHGVKLERYLSMVVRYGCENKPKFDNNVSEIKGEKPVMDNLNIRAEKNLKRCIANWGKLFGRKPNEQTLFLLRKFLMLDVPFEELAKNFTQEPDPARFEKAFEAVKKKQRDSR